jgi:predicted solute-binding protein
MSPAKRIGIPDVVYCQPFLVGLHEEPGISLVIEPAVTLPHLLQTRKLEAAFVSPIDFARNASEYFIVPGAAVSSPAGNNSVTVHFREGARGIHSLAVQPASPSDIVLAKILLTERFDLNPRIVPMAGGTLEEMLTKADAALLTGDEAFRYADPHLNAIDLVEEWIGATDLPYVHGFWAGREDALTQAECAVVVSAGSRGLGALSEAGGSPARQLETFSFGFSDEVHDGIREFLRYAYYHGIIPDVPDLRFYPGEGDSFPTPPTN